MKTLIALLCVGLSVLDLTAVDDRKLALIDELLVLTEQQEKMDDIARGALEQFRSLIEAHARPTDDDFTRRFRARIVEKYEALVRETMGWNRWRERYRRVYDEALSTKDLEALIAFYKSDTGKNLLKVIKDLGLKMGERIEAEKATLESKVDLIFDEAQSEVRKELARKGEPGATDNPDDAQRSREDH